MHPDIPVCCIGCEPEVKGGKAVLSLPLDAGYGVIYIFVMALKITIQYCSV